MKYRYTEDLLINSYDEGTIYTFLDSDQVVCLQKFESELLDVLLSNEYEKAVRILKEKYLNENVEKDIKEFCEELVNMRIIERY